MKEQNIILSLFCYLLLLLCSLFIAVVVWNSFADGVLYRCMDPLLDLWPPFVNAAAGDTYLVPERLVMAIWGGFVVGAFSLPALVIWVVWRFARDRHDNETELAV
jgi:hypothetical protein